MNVQIGAEAAVFPEKEYISGILLAVHITLPESSILSNLDRTTMERELPTSPNRPTMLSRTPQQQEFIGFSDFNNLMEFASKKLPQYF